MIFDILLITYIDTPVIAYKWQIFPMKRKEELYPK